MHMMCCLHPAGFEQPAGPAEPQLAHALARTNAWRARHQVPALAWDDQLAAQAAEYLGDCPKTVSAPRGVGENMAWYVQPACMHQPALHPAALDES
jgi:hypothetical protein